MGDLLPAQAQRGVAVAALVHDHSRGALPREEVVGASGRGVRVYRVPSHGRLLYAPVSPQFPFWLRRVIRSFRPDLLHLHLPNTSAFSALVPGVARRLPWVIHWHADVVAAPEVPSRLAWAYRLYRPFEQRLLAASRAVIVTSPPYLESSAPLRRWREKCHVIPLGLDRDRYPEPDTAARSWAEGQWSGGRVRVLAVGRLTYYKGFDVLIRAVTRVEGVQVRIVGEGEMRPSLERLIGESALAERAALLGHCAEPELHGLMAGCDCLVLPSIERTEAFGMVLLEAMRYGKPVIATAIPGSGPGWVVEHGRTGWLVPPLDVDALADALERMAADAPGRQRMGEAGAQRLGAHFEIDGIAQRITALYADLLARAPGRSSASG